MIYDIHTHFWKPGELSPQVAEDAKRAGGVFHPDTMSSEKYLKDTSAVDRSVVFGIRAGKSGFNVSNDTVRALVDLAPDRLVFFTSVDPAEEGFMDELERTHQDYGARGIKLGPIYQGVHPGDKRYRQIYSYAQKHSLPILIHMATTFSQGTPIEYARPGHMDEIAIDYPDLKIILAHLGHPWIGETIAIIRKQPNIYADISALYYRPWQFYNAMQLLVEYETWRKVFFGSDYPATLPQDSVNGIRDMNHIVEGTGLPQIPKEIIEGILYQETFKILGIE